MNALNEAWPRYQPNSIKDLYAI